MLNYTEDNTPEQRVALAKALIDAVNEVTVIVADDKNPHYKSQFASLKKHLELVKPVFKKHGMVILQMPIGQSHDAVGSVGIRTTILHESGAFIYSDAYIPAGKQADGQDAGKIFSYLRRYGIAAVAGLATEDDDGESDRIAKSAARVPASLPPARNVASAPVPTTATVARASSNASPYANEKLMFGKFKGYTLGQTAATPDGRSWLEWKLSQPACRAGQVRGEEP